MRTAAVYRVVSEAYQAGGLLTAPCSLCGPVVAGCRSGSECESGCEQGHGCGPQVAGGCHGGQEAAAEGSLGHGQLGVPGALCGGESSGQVLVHHRSHLGYFIYLIKISNNSRNKHT